MKFNFNAQNFLKLDYWLEPFPPTGQLFFLILAVGFSVLLLTTGVAVWWLRKKYFKKNLPVRKLLAWILYCLFSFSSVSLLLTFFRIEKLGWVSSRLVWAMEFLTLLFLAAFFLYYYKFKVPPQLREIESKSLKQKYLRPKRQ